MKCLIVEDDPTLSAQLAQAMRDGGFARDLAADGTQGEFLARPKAMTWRSSTWACPACRGSRC